MVYLILMVLVCLGVAIVAIQNSTTVQLAFLTWTFETNLIVVIIISLLAGLFIAFCWGLKIKTQHYLQDRKTQEYVKSLEEDKKILQGKLAQLAEVPKEILGDTLTKQAETKDGPQV